MGTFLEAFKFEIKEGAGRGGGDQRNCVLG